MGQGHMKTKSKSRRLYKRNGVILLCWEGRVWMPADAPSFDAADKVLVGDYTDPSRTVLEAEVESTHACVRWVPCPEFSSERKSKRARIERPRLPARKPGCEGFMVFLPPGSGGQPLGLPIVTEVPDAIPLVIDAVERYGVGEEMWDMAKWGKVIDRYDLREVASVSRDGKLTWACERSAA